MVALHMHKDEKRCQ